jgi:4-diphosphocytidyl-2-C-methyl-D-erythritol kinase
MKRHELSLSAPAKLNLFLHITGRRADGYHLLQTVFQFIDLCDELSVRVRTDGKIICHSDSGVAPEHDLATRAAHLLKNHSNGSWGAEIHIHKKIPLGGGLGGGSSDAAAVLLGLNLLWHCGYSRSLLAQLGLTLGADVPIFIHGQAAWAEGVGEHIFPLKTLEQPWYIVIYPDCHVCTQEIFCDPQLTRACKFITIADFTQGCTTHNVCEDVVKRRYPQVAQALKWLNHYAPARMSGTGSCIFAPVNDYDHACAVIQHAPWPAWAVKGMNQSPLCAYIDAQQALN